MWLSGLGDLLVDHQDYLLNYEAVGLQEPPSFQKILNRFLTQA